MIVGYARISDKTQNLESQVDQLKAHGCERVVTEIVTGIAEDKQLNKLIVELTEEDTLVVTRADRLARNAVQVLLVAEKLEKKNVNLVIMDFGVDTRTPVGKAMLAVMAALGQWERDNLKEKQKRGIEAARKRGKHLGRKGEFTRAGLEEAIRMYQEGTRTVKEIADITCVSKATLYRRLKEKGLK